MNNNTPNSANDEANNQNDPLAYALTAENVFRIIHSDTVPDDDDGLEFDLEDCEVSIKKPYIDKDGYARGNSIYIQYRNGMTLFFSVEQDQFLFTFYREPAHDSFTMLADASPQYIHLLVDTTWKAIVADMKEREDAWFGRKAKLTLADFATQFGEHPVPDLLQQLFALQEAYERNSLANGFYLWDRGHPFIEDMFPGKDMTQHFIEFATANGSGSAYAFWITDPDLAQCPIAVFGDEGGCHIIARNIAELIHLLTFDAKVYVSYENAWFSKDEEPLKKSNGHYGLIKWAKEKLSIDPITTAEQAQAIVKKAQAEYQSSFVNFLSDHGVDFDKPEVSEEEDKIQAEPDDIEGQEDDRFEKLRDMNEDEVKDWYKKEGKLILEEFMETARQSEDFQKLIQLQEERDNRKKSEAIAAPEPIIINGQQGYLVPVVSLLEKLPEDCAIRKSQADRYTTERAVYFEQDTVLDILDLDNPFGRLASDWNLRYTAATDAGDDDEKQRLSMEYDRQVIHLIFVAGDLTVSHNITNTDTGGSTSIIVMGNLHCPNIAVGGQEIYVQHHLTVDELYWGDYNHGNLTVKGDMTASALVETDQYTVMVEGKRQIDYFYSDWDYESKILCPLNDVFYEDILEVDGDTLETKLSIDKIRYRLAKGLPLVKKA